MDKRGLSPFRLKVRFGVAARKWDRFWFQFDGQYQLRIFRVLIGCLLSLFFITRLFDLNLYYSDSGILPIELVDSFGPVKYLFAYHLWSVLPSAQYVFGGLSVVASLFLAFGVYPRVSALCVFLAHLAFSQRNPMLVYGFDKVVAFFLISLMMGDSSAKPLERHSFGYRLTSLAVRLGQIQLAIVYVFSGLEKLKGQMWWRGESVWAVLANRQMAQYDFSWTSHFPAALTLANYGTLVWEIYFIALVWRRALTYPVLIGGVMLHGGIALAMGLPYFACGMVFSYAFFLEPIHARLLQGWVRTHLLRGRSKIFFRRKKKTLQVSAQSSDPISV